MATSRKQLSQVQDLTMQPFYVMTERFRRGVNGWDRFYEWANIAQLDEVVSLDGMLCPPIVQIETSEDWDHSMPIGGGSIRVCRFGLSFARSGPHQRPQCPCCVSECINAHWPSGRDMLDIRVSRIRHSRGRNLYKFSTTDPGPTLSNLNNVNKGDMNSVIINAKTPA